MTKTTYAVVAHKVSRETGCFRLGVYKPFGKQPPNRHCEFFATSKLLHCAFQTIFDKSFFIFFITFLWFLLLDHNHLVLWRTKRYDVDVEVWRNILNINCQHKSLLLAVKVKCSFKYYFKYKNKATCKKSSPSPKREIAKPKLTRRWESMNGSNPTQRNPGKSKQETKIIQLGINVRNPGSNAAT